MDINRINEFLVLSVCLNFSKAAKKLFLTQSVLSRHIYDLESRLGVTLLIRNTHRVQLTREGELFAVEAEKIMQQYYKSMQVMKDAVKEANQELNLGFLDAAVKPFLKGFLMKFEEECPHVKLNLETYHLDTLLKAFYEDKVDVGFITYTRHEAYQDFKCRHIFNDKLFLVLDKNHPLAEQKQLSIEDLDGIPMINFSKETNPCTYDFHKFLFESYNTKFNVVEEVNNVETALFFASLGKGGFIIPEHLSHMLTDQKMIPLTNEECYVDITLIMKKEKNNKGALLFEKKFFEHWGD